jgi:serine/threonine protein kinase
MDSRAVLGRFEAERQALALMDHPNIAKVLDAGTTADQRPYFVMELVKGTPITDFCDARKLSARERLELFVAVCQAIQHAHTKGIIHRDIKPSNVLVALHDERPVPKVIDFGVAKAVGQQLTEKTLYTGFGALIGTPAYMAPEQALGNPIDGRTDLYSLGGVAYFLLTGQLVFQGAEGLQMIVKRLQEDPVPPSARTELVIPPELERIVMQCLARDPALRPQSALELDEALAAVPVPAWTAREAAAWWKLRGEVLPA